MTLSCELFGQKYTILDTWIGFEYTCIQISSNNVFCHHNKHLMGYFEFLYGSGIICLLLKIPKKLHWQHLFESQKRQTLIAFILVTIQTIQTHPEEQHLSFKQTGSTIIFSFGCQFCVWPSSDPLFCQNPCCGCNSGNDLVVALKYSFFQICSNAE